MHPTPTVVITGASAGVGRATAHAFARHGARIGLIARERMALEDTRVEVERLGGQGLVLPADVADPQAVEDAAANAEAILGPIDIWVNSAMVTVFSPIRDLSPEEIRRVTEVTYLGAVHGFLAALRRMLPRDRGTLVQVGSALAYRGIPLQAAYCGAKFALRGFLESLRSELIHEGSHVQVTMVHIPAINTPQFDWARTHLRHRPRPVGPVFEPEVAANAIVHAAFQPRREYWLGTSTVQAILGGMVAPGLLDRMMARTWEGQETHRPLPGDYQDNLFAPVRGLHRTRGSFGNEARLHSRTFLPTAVRGLVAAAGGALAAGVAAGLVSMARR